MTPRDYLASLEFHGVKLGLENITALLSAAGDPQTTYPSVHVGGTNGKGSVVAFLDAILRAAGYRVGRFTSPHLLDVTERFQVDGVPISSGDLDENITCFQEIAEALPHPPTYFELNTAIAFRYFQQARVDIALVEVGMGGRFDSTNVLAPIATAITNIDLEHTTYLGDTLEKIAFEKAGILKTETPLILAETFAAPRSVILERARELHCPVLELGRDFSYTIKGDSFSQVFAYNGKQTEIGPVNLPLAGRYQGDNAATALALAEVIQLDFPRVTAAVMLEGIANARWPGRLETVSTDPWVILDVAHNPQGARRLAEAVPRSIFVLAVSDDKDAESMIAALAPKAELLILTAFDGRRAMPLETLAAAAGVVPHCTSPTLAAAIELGTARADAEVPLVVTGSIFTVGQASALLRKPSTIAAAPS